MTSKRTVTRAIFLAALLTILGASVAGAQVYYMYPGAPPVTDAEPALGATVGLADNLLRLLGYGRFNVSTKSDIGFEIVVDDHRDNWRFGLGADFKYAIIPDGTALPVDLTAQLGFGFQTGGSVTNFDIPIAGLVSRALQMDNGRIIVPYGGLYVIVRHFNRESLPGDTDLDVELRAGSSFELFDSGDLFVTLHIAEEIMFFAGFNASF
jgi:hypothetical protein